MARDLNRYRDAERRLWNHVGVNPTERFVTLASGESIRVQETGEGPPFVLIHGGSICGSSWATLVGALDGVRCIMIDRPGCGLSDRIVDGPLDRLSQLESYADTLLTRVLDALELDEAAVGATSYGGYFAFRGAAAAPRRVTKLVEYSWLIGAPSESAPLTARLASLTPVKRLLSSMPMPRAMVKPALAQFGLGRAIASGAFDDVMLDWTHALLAHTDTSANEVWSTPDIFTLRGQNDAVLLPDELLSRVTMPVLFVWGADDPNGGEAVAREFAPRLPNTELLVVPEAEHAPWLDDPDTCIEATRRFLLD